MKLSCYTVRELAEVLSRSIDPKDVLHSKFVNCDFAIIDELEMDKPLEDIRRDATGWYGIKRIDAGFDSEDLLLIADYYGGGCAHLLQVWSGLDGYLDVQKEIEDVLINTLTVQESATLDTGLIVEFLPKDEPDRHTCSVCGYKEWWSDDTADDYNEIWCCEVCGKTICAKCLIDAIGKEKYNEMLQSGEYIRCPDCFEKAERDAKGGK